MTKAIKVHQPCDACGSSDAKAYYPDGGSFCFSCSDSKSSNQVEDTTPEKELLSGYVPQNGLKTRGIDAKTMEFFGYSVLKQYTGYIADSLVRDAPIHIATIKNRLGKPVAQQLRTMDKKFHMIKRRASEELGLSGTHLYEPSENIFATITEGYIDQMSVAQACGLDYPVLTVPHGAQTAHKAIQKDLEYLSKFKYVVLAFDNDKAGIAATEKCISLFEPGKVRVASWPQKDANDLLLTEPDKIKKVLFNAKAIKPDKILKPSDLLDKVCDRPSMGIEWPFKELDQMTMGLKENQLIVLGAGPGIGKSHFIDNLSYGLIEKKVKTAIFSFEHDPDEVLLKLAGMKLGRPLHVPGEWWNTDEIKRAVSSFDDSLVVYDPKGVATLEDLSSKIRYVAKAEGVKFVVVDNLTEISSESSKTDRALIDECMATFRQLKQELRISIILAVHLSYDKRTGKVDSQDTSWGRGRVPVLESFKGSQNIGSAADVALGLSRNAEADNDLEKSLLHVHCLKSRINGMARGTRFTLQYVPDQNRLVRYEEVV